MAILQNKTAIVTGAGAGIGEATAKLYAAEGAKVVVSDLHQDSIDRVVQEITGQGGIAAGVICNVALEEDVDRLFAFALNRFEKIDILVNNAGIMDNFQPVADLTNELWDRVMNVNLRGPFMTMRLAVRYMLEHGGGTIINIASVGGLFGVRGGASYVASKHGLIGLTKNTAAIYHDSGIRCVVIAPGAVETTIGSTITQPNLRGMNKLTSGVGPAPMGKPIDIAQTALFLASDAAEFVNGAVLVADGGWTVY